jgi:hypothetical protein
MRLVGEARYGGAVGQHDGAEESRPLYTQAPIRRTVTYGGVSRSGAPGEVWVKRRHHLDLFSRSGLR